MLIAPVGALRPLSVPAGPFSTSSCSMLNTSRETEPRSRTPSTKMLLELSKPRMNKVSPVAVLPFSPTKKVPTPGLLRSASVRVVAPCWLNRSSVMIWMVCGVSCNDWVNLGEASLSALYSPTEAPSTCTSGRVVGSGLGVLSEATWAAAGTASARLVRRVAAVRPFGERDAGVACLRDLIGFMGGLGSFGRESPWRRAMGERSAGGPGIRIASADSGARRRVAVRQMAGVGPEPEIAGSAGRAARGLEAGTVGGSRGARGVGFAFGQGFDGGDRVDGRTLPACGGTSGSGVLGACGGRRGRRGQMGCQGRAGRGRDGSRHRRKQPRQRTQQSQQRPEQGAATCVTGAGRRKEQGEPEGQPDNELIILMIIVLFRKDAPDGKAKDAKKGGFRGIRPYGECRRPVNQPRSSRVHSPPCSCLTGNLGTGE